MKNKALIFGTAFILLTLCVGSGCEKDTTQEFVGPVEGYVTGTFQCYEYENGIGTSNQKPTPRGFCILLKGSKNTGANKPMDFYTFNFPIDLFEFPNELLLDKGFDCGPYFFPESQQEKFKITLKYKDVKESEKIEFSCGMCPAINLYFPWSDYNQAILDELVRNN